MVAYELWEFAESVRVWLSRPNMEFVAQLAEHLFVAQVVAGSSPVKLPQCDCKNGWKESIVDIFDFCFVLFLKEIKNGD